MTRRRFIQCDVFSPHATLGNALAVVVDGEGLADEQMQRFAAWTNLAETTFLLPPRDAGADYRVKIFTPLREMLFAGHPTLGSCAAWLRAGGKPRRADVVFQECAIGLVEIAVGDAGLLEFIAPPTAIRPLQAEPREAICGALGIAPRQVVDAAELDNGPVFRVIELDSADTLLALDAARIRWPEFRGVGLFAARPAGQECDYEVRLLAPSSGMSEDPITGSLNSALAHWLQTQGRLRQPLTLAQGTAIGRHGRVFVRPLDDGRVAIGGHTHILIDGEVELRGEAE